MARPTRHDTYHPDLDREYRSRPCPGYVHVAYARAGTPARFYAIGWWCDHCHKFASNNA